MKDIYKELSKRIDHLERYTGSVHFETELYTISGKIDWAWKFRHITEQQMNELCDRIIKLNEGDE